MKKDDNVENIKNHTKNQQNIHKKFNIFGKLPLPSINQKKQEIETYKQYHVKEEQKLLHTDESTINPNTINQLERLHQSIHRTPKTIETMQNIQENQQNWRIQNNNIFGKLPHDDKQKEQEEVKQNGKESNKEEQKL